MTLESVETKTQNFDYKNNSVGIEDDGLLEKSDSVEEKPNYLQEYITTAISTLGMLVAGVHFAWIGPILPQLLSGAFKIQITMEQSVWVMACLQLGAVPGSIVGSIIANHFGRKRTIILITIPYIISATILIFAENVTHYYIVRLIGGIGVGASYSVIPMYISEIASPEVRGLLGTSIYLTMSVGVLLAFCFGAYLPIVTNAIVCSIFPIIMLISAFYMPESPYYYVIKEDYENAEKSLVYLRKKKMVRDEVKRLTEGIKAENAERNQSFWDLFRVNTNRKALLVVSVLLMSQQWTGATAIFGYSQVIFEEGHSSISAESCGVFLALMNFAVVFLCCVLIDRLGRRKLLMVSGLITILPLAALGFYFYLQDVVKYEHIEYLRLTPLIAIVAFKFSFGIGMSPIPYVLLGELFPTSVKAYAASFVSVYGSIVGVAANKMYQVVYSEFHYPLTFAMFIGWLSLFLLFIYFMVPETKGLSLEEIQVNLKKSAKK